RSLTLIRTAMLALLDDLRHSNGRDSRQLPLSFPFGLDLFHQAGYAVSVLFPRQGAQKLGVGGLDA
ncbi:MAG TPA: hypothetical protein VE078_11590, partial [Thermoanaerobaculia bacterium]|nr:hypothetical protein [Thermoanaerobaculia bacterium]